MKDGKTLMITLLKGEKKDHIQVHKCGFQSSVQIKGSIIIIIKQKAVWIMMMMDSVRYSCLWLPEHQGGSMQNMLRIWSMEHERERGPPCTINFSGRQSGGTLRAATCFVSSSTPWLQIWWIRFAHWYSPFRPAQPTCSHVLILGSPSTRIYRL